MAPNSFFEKLKKGMGIEVEEKVEKEEKEEEVKEMPRVQKPKRPKTLKIKTEAIETRVEKVELPKVKEIPQEVPEKLEIKKEEWLEPEGELAIDVYQTENHLVIQSAIAGVKPEFLEISMERDIVTIKGVREKPFEEKGDYFTQECYWGPFSREVIMPVEVDPDRAEASMKEGILTIRIPKILREKKRTIKVKV